MHDCEGTAAQGAFFVIAWWFREVRTAHYSWAARTWEKKLYRHTNQPHTTQMLFILWLRGQKKSVVVLFYFELRCLIVLLMLQTHSASKFIYTIYRVDILQPPNSPTRRALGPCSEADVSLWTEQPSRLNAVTPRRHFNGMSLSGCIIIMCKDTMLAPY